MRIRNELTENLMMGKVDQLLDGNTELIMELANMDFSPLGGQESLNDEVRDVAWEVAPQLPGIAKVLLVFVQISVSFVDTLFSVPWPPIFMSVCTWLDQIVNLQFLNDLIDALAFSVDG